MRKGSVQAHFRIPVEAMRSATMLASRSCACSDHGFDERRTRRSLCFLASNMETQVQLTRKKRIKGFHLPGIIWQNHLEICLQGTTKKNNNKYQLVQNKLGSNKCRCVSALMWDFQQQPIALLPLSFARLRRQQSIQCAIVYDVILMAPCSGLVAPPPQLLAPLAAQSVCACRRCVRRVFDVVIKLM